MTTIQHDFTSRIEWTGNRGEGTRSYRGYDRTWSATTPGKPVIHCSNDPRLGGNQALPNPEDMLLSALAACHNRGAPRAAAVNGPMASALIRIILGAGAIRTIPRLAGFRPIDR